MMNISNSYFAISNPLDIIDKWFHPYRFGAGIDYHGRNLKVSWTKRAETALQNRTSPLIVEMQIYFSCVVQKRVIFHDQLDVKTVPVNNFLHLILRPVQADSCDPIEFARNHPVAYEYTSQAAINLRPSLLQLDFRKNHWCGEFAI